MTPKVALLACGSFNPPTNAHLRMFERARDHFVKKIGWQVIEGIISPVNNAYKKPGLVSSRHRLNMLRLSLETSSWIRADDWECSLNEWCRTLLVLRYFKKQLLAKYSNLDKKEENTNSDSNGGEPSNKKVKLHSSGNDLKLMILCGSDFLESFAVPALWLKEDIEEIVRDFGLVVIYREGTNPYKFVYDHEVLYKHQSNIHIVHEWIVNDVSSTKVRLALSRGESVRYLIPDKVVDYINENHLYAPHDEPGSNSTKIKTNGTKSNGSKINDDGAKVEKIDDHSEKEETHQRTRMKNKNLVKSSTNVKSAL